MRVWVMAGLVALGAMPVGATTHHNSHTSSPAHHGSSKSGKKSSNASHHSRSSHASTKTAKSAHGKSTHGDKKQDAKRAHAAAAPAGAISVGSGGTKLFCAGRASPLLVRKATQGNGTTVTVICR